MCGIFAIIGEGTTPELIALVTRLLRMLQHRGPDWEGIWVAPNAILAHQRLAIMDVAGGEQPIVSKSGDVALSVNGEIYNFKEIRSRYNKYNYTTNSDCEVILPLWEEKGDEFVNELSGDFGFVIYNKKTQDWLVARDPIGVVPLYIGYTKNGGYVFASEMKCLKENCVGVSQFPPGHYMSNKTNGEFCQWFKPVWGDPFSDFPKTTTREILKQSFLNSVRKRLMSEVPYGVLLSGGLDSSLVAASAMRLLRQKDAVFGSSLHSYSIGLPGAPDLIKAREVAEFIKTKHHEFHFTFEQGINALRNVIWHLETYDVTTIRAGTPMFLLARRIKAMGVKMVLSGEGSDEMFGGYLYFHNAPTEKEFHHETVRKVCNLHNADCLRANKSTSAWGLEVRVPFLDRDFLDVAFSIPTSQKMCGGGKMEKSFLREAFEDPNDPYLPHDILWRQKEQFSDGVGYGWIDALKSYAENQITNPQLHIAQKRYLINTPKTKEALLYRILFEEQFPEKGCDNSVQTWLPTWSTSNDPSGRAQQVHQDTLNF